MASKDLMALYGRLGLIIAAFALITAIVAEPLLPRFWSSSVTVAEQQPNPVRPMRPIPAALTVDEQG
jgi:hypothetical protein